jgi:hypothetical protein
LCLKNENTEAAPKQAAVNYFPNPLLHDCSVFKDHVDWAAHTNMVSLKASSHSFCLFKPLHNNIHNGNLSYFLAMILKYNEFLSLKESIHMCLRHCVNCHMLCTMASIRNQNGSKTNTDPIKFQRSLS